MFNVIVDARRRQQRHGRTFHRRAGLEMSTVSNATSKLLPRPRPSLLQHVGFGKMIALFNSKYPDVLHLPLSSTASCFRIVSLRARSRAAAAAQYSCFRAWLQWCAHGEPTRFADSTNLTACCATTYAMAHGLPGPRNQQMNNPFNYSLTRRLRVQLPPVRARATCVVSAHREQHE